MNGVRRRFFRGDFGNRSNGIQKARGLKGKNHKNLLKKPQNVRGVNTLLTFWGHHMG
jgi:hypothetical protein